MAERRNCPSGLKHAQEHGLTGSPNAAGWLLACLGRTAAALLGSCGLYRWGFSAPGAWGQGRFQAEKQEVLLPGVAAHVLLHTTADTPVAASVPVSQPAQRPFLLLDPLVPPYPRAFAFACHLCGHMSVNRQSWAGDYICYSNSTFYFKTCLQFGSVPTPSLSLPPLPLMPLPPNSSVTPISLWGGKRGKTDLD